MHITPQWIVVASLTIGCGAEPSASLELVNTGTGESETRLALGGTVDLCADDASEAATLTSSEPDVISVAPSEYAPGQYHVQCAELRGVAAGTATLQVVEDGAVLDELELTVIEASHLELTGIDPVTLLPVENIRVAADCSDWSLCAFATNLRARASDGGLLMDNRYPEITLDDPMGVIASDFPPLYTDGVILFGMTQAKGTATVRVVRGDLEATADIEVY